MGADKRVNLHIIWELEGKLVGLRAFDHPVIEDNLL